MKAQVLVLIALMTIALTGVSCKDDDADTSDGDGSDKATEQATLPPVRAGDRVEADGKVVPVQHAALAFPVGGTVAKVMVEPGEAVEAGQVLVRLDSAQQAAAVLKAMADLAAAQADLGVAAAAATATPASNAAAGAVEAARARLDQMQAQLEQAEVQADQTELRAPFAGTVAAVHVGEGEVAGAGAPVVELGDESAWLIETDNLTERNVVGVDPGDRATIAVDAIPDLDLEGVVVRVSPIGEVRTGDVVYTVVVRPDRHDERLRWNMTATVTIDRDADDD